MVPDIKENILKGSLKAKNINEMLQKFSSEKKKFLAKGETVNNKVEAF